MYRINIRISADHLIANKTKFLKIIHYHSFLLQVLLFIMWQYFQFSDQLWSSLYTIPPNTKRAILFSPCASYKLPPLLWVWCLLQR